MFFVSQAGLIRTDKGEFFIEPLQKGQQESEVQGRVHVVYPRSAVKRQNQEDLHNEGEELESMEWCGGHSEAGLLILLFIMKLNEKVNIRQDLSS